MSSSTPFLKLTSKEAFHRMQDEVDAAVLAALKDAEAKDAVDLQGAPVKGPASTWTYVINDDPFRNQMGMTLTGPGKTTFAIGAALFAMPLLILWGLVERFYARRSRRRLDPRRGPAGRR